MPFSLWTFCSLSKLFQEIVDKSLEPAGINKILDLLAMEWTETGWLGAAFWDTAHTAHTAKLKRRNNQLKNIELVYSIITSRNSYWEIVVIKVKSLSECRIVREMLYPVISNQSYSFFLSDDNVEHSTQGACLNSFLSEGYHPRVSLSASSSS